MSSCVGQGNRTHYTNTATLEQWQGTNGYGKRLHATTTSKANSLRRHMTPGASTSSWQLHRVTKRRFAYLYGENRPKYGEKLGHEGD